MSAQDDLPGVLRDLDACRTAVHERLVHENEVTEREVLAIGENVDTIVGQARAHVDDISHALSGLDEQGSIPDIIEAQGKAMDGFLAGTRERTQRLQTLSAEAIAKCDTIARAGNSIASVAWAVKILAINAAVEAARISGSEGFSVIATEMQRLSEAVEASNQEVSEVVDELLQSLPDIGGEARRLHQDSQQFQHVVDAQGVELKVRADGLNKVIEQCRVAGETRLSRILEASDEAEGHLVFQDPVQQRLLRIDEALLLLRTSVLTRLGANEAEVREVRPAAHHQTGMSLEQTDEEPVLDAGEMLLF